MVGYTKAADSETIETQYELNIPPTTGRVLYINKRIENQAQAERMAKAELRDKNRKEQTASLSGMGDTRFRAGTVLHSGMGPLRLEVRDRSGDAHVLG